MHMQGNMHSSQIFLPTYDLVLQVIKSRSTLMVSDNRAELPSRRKTEDTDDLTGRHSRYLMVVRIRVARMRCSQETQPCLLSGSDRHPGLTRGDLEEMAVLSDRQPLDTEIQAQIDEETTDAPIEAGEQEETADAFIEAGEEEETADAPIDIHGTRSV